MTPQEIPSPWQQMAEKLDPVIYDEMSTAVVTSIIYGYRLLKKSGYNPEKAMSIASSLGRNAYIHEFPIFSKEATDLGFDVGIYDKETMKTYQELVAFRIGNEYPKHIIDSYYPEVVKKNENKNIRKKYASKK